MKRFLLFTITALSMTAILPSKAATLDSEGMPIVYLRGDFRNTNWAPKDNYRFTRNGNEYTYVIDKNNSLDNCQFKIADDEWEIINIGADVSVNSSMYVQGIKAGPNMRTEGLSDCVISFTYTPDDNKTLVKFIVDGQELKPEERPDVSSKLSGTLPVLYINVFKDEEHSAFDDEIISKDLSHKNYFENAEYWLDTKGCTWLEELGAENVGSKEEPLPLQIKARGNWTRIGFSKKPFKLKLDKKQSLLGLSKSKHFAILAHADDRMGYLRNFVGFELGKRIGLPWTPTHQPVEVIINGDYRGLYFLTESIRVDKERVDIVELNDNEEKGELVSGGYIVELDNYDEDEFSQISMDEKHCASGHHNYDRLRITFDTPEVYSDLQRHFITDQFTHMNDYVGENNDALWSYIDLDDAARYYLVHEITSNVESYHGSTYLFRDFGEGQKWHFSPLWDMGNAFNGHTDNFFYNCDPFGNTWIPSMRENEKFNQKVKETWLWFMSNEFEGLYQDMNEYVSHLSSAAKADFERWHDAPIPGGGQAVADNRNIQDRNTEAQNHLRQKIEWLKKQFGDYTSGVFTEPERDTTPAAELPSYALTGIDLIDMEESVSNENVEFFNLQGMRISNPQPGTICIMRTGTTAKKVLTK